MHREFFTVDEQLVKALATHQNGRIIPVGTTSLRALESLYHLALQPERLLAGSGLEQWEAYEESERPGRSKVFSNLLSMMHIEDLTEITTSTSILIAPGYAFRVADGLITNFHLPKSTLILLVAAMTGEDWRKIYDFALENDFRFLSYGDSSLLLP
jgi:S-adenosylmethionine:tRNA ribosyltransferase-isomerase